jgi:hypothetical protein
MSVSSVVLLADTTGTSLTAVSGTDVAEQLLDEK